MPNGGHGPFDDVYAADVTSAEDARGLLLRRIHALLTEDGLGTDFGEKQDTNADFAPPTPGGAQEIVVDGLGYSIVLSIKVEIVE